MHLVVVFAWSVADPAGWRANATVCVRADDAVTILRSAIGWLKDMVDQYVKFPQLLTWFKYK